MSARGEVVYDYGFDFETGESCPAAGITEMPAQPSMPAIGACVRLRNCNFGQAGIVLRHERGKAIVRWPDLDFVGRHSSASLVEVRP